MALPDQNHVLLDDVPVPIAAGAYPRRFNASQTPDRVTTGDSVRLNDVTPRSTLVYSEFEGLGRYRHRQQAEGVGRFWDSTADTRWKGFLTLPPATVGMTPTTSHLNTHATITGWGSGHWTTSLKSSGATPNQVPVFTYFQYILYPADNLTTSLAGCFAGAGGTEAELIAAATNIAYTTANWQGNTYWARGPAAYVVGTDVLNATGVSRVGNLTPGYNFIAMAPARNLLWGFCYSSTTPNSFDVYYTAQAGSSGQSWGGPVTTFKPDEAAEQLRQAVAGYAQDGRPCIYLVTTRKVYQFDPYSLITQPIYRFTQPATTYDPHAVWWDKTGELYVANNRDLVAIGAGDDRHISPYQDDGLPRFNVDSDVAVGFTGPITSLFTTERNLCCVLQGDANGANGPALLVWDESGWHCIAKGPTNRTWGAGIAVNDAKYIFEGGGGANRIVGVFDPVTVRPPWTRDSGEYVYAPIAQVTQAWDDCDLPNIWKIADQYEVQMLYASVNQYMTVEYQLEQPGTAWTTLGTAIAKGTTVFNFGTTGVAFKRIRFRYTLVTNNNTLAPLVELSGIKFIVAPQVLWAWQLDIDCRRDEKGYGGRTPEQLADYVKSLIGLNRLVKFSYGRQAVTYVLVTQTQGTDSLDEMEHVGRYSLTLTQVNPDR